MSTNTQTKYVRLFLPKIDRVRSFLYRVASKGEIRQYGSPTHPYVSCKLVASTHDIYIPSNPGEYDIYRITRVDPTHVEYVAVPR